MISALALVAAARCYVFDGPLISRVIYFPAEPVNESGEAEQVGAALCAAMNS